MSVRRTAAAGAVAVIAVGLASRRIHLGIALWDKSLGDVLYAVMIGLIVLVVRPDVRPRVLGLVTFGICFLIELFQWTGIPARAPHLVQLALGTTFAWHDVACYGVGALIAVVLGRRLS